MLFDVNSAVLFATASRDLAHSGHMAIKHITLFHQTGVLGFPNVEKFAMGDSMLRFTTKPDAANGSQKRYATTLPFLIELDTEDA